MRRIGVDTGGTFTDCVLVDDETGRVVVEKVPSQPATPEKAILNGLLRLVAQAGLQPGDIDAVIHGTTIATNIVIEGTYARAGVIATSGCRDVLEIGTQQRYQPYDLLHAPKVPLVPRDLRIEVAGRIAADGTEVTPLDEEAVVAAVRKLEAAGVRSIAVTGLFSYENPAHERRIAELVRETAPGIYVVASSDVSREVREYPRFATTAVNATLAPLLDPYIRQLQAGLEAEGFRGALYVMQSSGGIATAARSMGEKAHHLVLSGPAAGIIGGIYASELSGLGNLVTLDIGGTSADIGIVANGIPRIRFDMQLPNGVPVQVPNLEIETIGAGGGSIAWIDGGGALQVGPQSAGARPGPVAFRLGGDKPTVTDAQVVLRRLNPGGLLGGNLKLDRDAAYVAIAALAKELGLTPEKMALGIVAVMEANMAGAIMRSAARHGDDLRDFTLVAAGGAGGLSVVPLAKALDIPRVLIPPHPGLLSAAGLLTSDLRHDLSAPVMIDTANPDLALIERVQGELEARVLDDLEVDGVPVVLRSAEHSVEIRYVGQEYSVNVATARGEGLSAITARFHETHERVYGHSAPDAPSEIVAIRVSGRGAAAASDLPTGAPLLAARVGETREVWFDEAGGYVTTPIVERFSLRPGDVVTGPAIIEQLDTTVVLLPGWRAFSNEQSCLIIEEVKP
ncbi:MAG: hydantoinase/oxoprolinase family protein [Parvibaculaceae bacterium]|nr:hydantoinase/oxoprolinase family protein [Parvibaculaceae bacterium]